MVFLKLLLSLPDFEAVAREKVLHLVVGNLPRIFGYSGMFVGNLPAELKRDGLPPAFFFRGAESVIWSIPTSTLKTASQPT